MTCAEMDRYADRRLESPALPPPDGAAGHVQACPRCSLLYGEWFAPAAAPDEVSSELRTAIRSRIGPVLTPVRPLPPAPLFVALFLLIYFAIIALSLALVGPYALARLSAAQLAALTVITVGGALLAATSLGAQMTPGARHRVRPSLLLWAIPITLALATAILFPFDRPWSAVLRGYPCSTAGWAFSLPVAAAVTLLMRRGTLLSPALVGATAGLFAGLAGSLVLSYHCPLLDAGHIMLWHAIGIPGVGAAAGMLAGLGLARLRS